MNTGDSFMTMRDEERIVLTKKGTVFFIAFALAIVGLALLVSAWMNALTLTVAPPMGEEILRVTGLQFETGYLNLTVKNTVARNVEIRQVAIENMDRPEVPEFKAIAYELVPAGEQISFSISYEWISGDTYQVRLTNSQGNLFLWTAVAP
jgi:hypothetical protein